MPKPQPDRNSSRNQSSGPDVGRILTETANVEAAKPCLGTAKHMIMSCPVGPRNPPEGFEGVRGSGGPRDSSYSYSRRHPIRAWLIKRRRGVRTAKSSKPGTLSRRSKHDPRRGQAPETQGERTNRRPPQRQRTSQKRLHKAASTVARQLTKLICYLGSLGHPDGPFDSQGNAGECPVTCVFPGGGWGVGRGAAAPSRRRRATPGVMPSECPGDSR